ncbi:urease accessory protein UreF [Sulfolobus islandicus]|uniref:Urease accessory protein UreF n=1 Tax=Saccharolobus islandicus (strain HVE10/4) TaxID=930943 RepID=F0NK16_SACI0|nr:urease accessory UreF family protein [Sulfolobus islandicus]ADX82332.1 urease accessory protein UreF [Sulfolobus islandicus HVE10/4]WCM36357.1 urease accessory protein UreF [Sulfolobus islandicus]
MNSTIIKAFQLFDSSLPIGSFNYSYGVEEAYHEGYDVKKYIKIAFREIVERGDIPIAKLSFKDPHTATTLSLASKLTKEIRDASINLARSLALLNLCEDEFVNKVKNNEIVTTYPVVVARCCVSMSIEQYVCLYGLAYSELAQMVYSAVRLGAIHFVKGQELISEIIQNVSINEEFQPFYPLMDVFSLSHERRDVKVFMS